MNDYATCWAYFQQIIPELLAINSAQKTHLNKQLEILSQHGIGGQHELIADFFDSLIRLDKAEEFGFQLGERVPLTAFCKMFLNMRIAPTYNDFLIMISGFQRLSKSPIQIDFNKEKSELSIGFKIAMSPQAEALFISATTTLINKDLSKITDRNTN